MEAYFPYPLLLLCLLLLVNGCTRKKLPMDAKNSAAELEALWKKEKKKNKKNWRRKKPAGKANKKKGGNRNTGKNSPRPNVPMLLRGDLLSYFFS